MQLYARHARPLAHDASRKALQAADTAPSEITHLVTVSCTGFSAPGFDLGLVEDLDLQPSVQRTHVGFMGCHGALNGLRVASAYAGSDHHARVLLCCAELCSLHFRFGTKSEDSVPNALFADGAAALVGVPDAGYGPAVWRAAASGSHVIPHTQDAITWHIGNHGFEMSLSPRVPGQIVESLCPWLEVWLSRYGESVASIRSWAVHPGGPRVLDAVEEALGLSRDATGASRDVLSSCGNMSSPTILFIVDRLQRSGAALPCVALAFGPGMTIEATLFV
jgi:predicted naringenin-chalcone synthase